MNETEAVQHETRAHPISSVVNRIRQIFGGSAIALDQQESPGMTRRKFLRVAGTAAAGALLSTIPKTTEASHFPPASDRSPFDLHEWIPEELREIVELRRIVQESQELLQKHPSVFYPVSEQNELPDVLIANLRKIQFVKVGGIKMASVAQDSLVQLLEEAELAHFHPELISGYRSR